LTISLVAEGFLDLLQERREFVVVGDACDGIEGDRTKARALAAGSS
jgi:hypothetical protein